MIYDFSGVDRVHLYMDDRNENMICECYRDGKVLREENIFSDYKLFQIYNFLNAMYSSGAEIFIGDFKRNLKEDLKSDDENENSGLLEFCQH